MNIPTLTVKTGKCLDKGISSQSYRPPAEVDLAYKWHSGRSCSVLAAVGMTMLQWIATLKAMLPGLFAQGY